MAYSKIKKILFILLCLFVILFPFWCVRGLCAEVEDVEISTKSNISITPNSNVFSSSSTYSTGYFELENGYIYHITFISTGSTRYLAVSNDEPSVNGTYQYLGSLNSGETYTYRGNSGYLYFSFSGASNVQVTREKLSSMDGAVNDLVDNVGINSIWNIFDISINYIVIVVVFALGCFIIFKLIRKVSKGKEGF